MTPLTMDGEVDEVIDTSFKAAAGRGVNHLVSART
jgi:hypothetical protein